MPAMKPKELAGKPVEVPGKLQSAMAMEREAHRFRAEGKIDQAFQTFDQAARLFQEANEHLRSAVCYASAATCWNIHTGWQPLRNAATRNEFAAVQALSAKDYAYAETLFSEAALLYEKEGDYTKYSYCYVRSKDVRLMRLWSALVFHRSEGTGTAIHLAEISWKDRLKALKSFCFSGLNRLIWGYGERPFQTLGLAVLIILVSAFFYYFSGAVSGVGVIQRVNFWDSLYFSAVTYTTVGYGDYVPLGWGRFIAAVEALSGILITPLFLISLTRCYLRMYR